MLLDLGNLLFFCSCDTCNTMGKVLCTGEYTSSRRLHNSSGHVVIRSLVSCLSKVHQHHSAQKPTSFPSSLLRFFSFIRSQRSAEAAACSLRFFYVSEVAMLPNLFYIYKHKCIILKRNL
jgi:hypothetical protein